MFKKFLLSTFFAVQAVCANAQLPGSVCNQTAIYDASTSGNTQIVAATTGTKIYICGYTLFSAGPSNVGLTTGTGTNCGTGNSKLTPYYELASETGISDQGATYRGMSTPASGAVCMYSSAAVAVQGIIYYTQF